MLLTIAEAFKGEIYLHFSHCFAAIFFHLVSRAMERKEIQFNEWKFMHMKTSNNSSNQSDFNKRFSFFLATRSRRREPATASGNLSFDGSEEICDDVPRLSKQLNEAERFVSFFFRQQSALGKDVS